MAYLEENDATPDIQPGDMDIMKSAHPDFIGFNYYTTHIVEANHETEMEFGFSDQQRGSGVVGVYKPFKNPNLPVTEFGWEIDPEGSRNTIREMYSRYRLPMLVTENGIGL